MKHHVTKEDLLKVGNNNNNNSFNDIIDLLNKDK